MDEQRQRLKNGEKILLCKEGTSNVEEFMIVGLDGSGASAICYFASCGRKAGRLKEFYPSEHLYDRVFSIVRNENNHLSVVAGAQKSKKIFDEMLNEYIAAHYALDEAKSKSKDNTVFNTFIPSFEIYRGCDENGSITGSAYIWTADSNSEIESFASIIKRIHAHPEDNPEKSTFLILNTMLVLVECVKSIHSAGLIHGDIKPANFGLPKRGGRYLCEHISMFDINSIYSIYSAFPKLMGTEGFCAPQVFENRVTNQSDLYSIGATLFNAVVLSDDVPDSLYRDEYYPDIDKIVASSKLLSSSPITANSLFQKKLAHILKKTLAPSCTRRVKSCDELMNDLKGAIVFLLPSQYNTHTDFGSELVLTQINKELESYNKADALFAIQNFLFKKPLFDTNADTINVLIIGFGVYGQLFLDQCLQAGQMIDKELKITVASNEIDTYKNEYLENRPALKDFFTIDGVSCSGESYGEITFCSVINGASPAQEGFVRDKKTNRELAKGLITGKVMPSYVFVALPDDDYNESVADACETVIKQVSGNCTIGYVCLEKGKQSERDSGAVPVCVKDKAEDAGCYAEIERMAFNAHLLWNNPINLNSDIEEQRAIFKKAYYHGSSVACVLSIKSKLHSLGINIGLSLSLSELAEAARQFALRIASDQERFAALVQVEHRRWIVEKITDGWKCKTDYSSCVSEGISDKKRKQHACIVRSQPNFNLEKKYKNEATNTWKAELWNKPCPEDECLDELDMVALNLHRTFYKQAQEVKNNYSLHGDDTRRVYYLIEDNREAVLAFNKLIGCLEHIWNMEEAHARLYEGLKSAFEKTIESFNEAKRKEILAQLNAIDLNATPILLACRFRYYKASDKDLVQAIPFILTYREDIKMLVPFSFGTNSQRFENVAAATLINPKSITYPCYLEGVEDVLKAKETISHVLTYLKSKRMKAELSFVFIYNESTAVNAEIAGLLRSVANLNQDGRIKACQVVAVENETEIATRLSELMSTADIYEHNATRLSLLLQETGFYESLADYSFNSANKQFLTSTKSEWLKYINGEQYLTATDMFSFGNATCTTAAAPDFGDEYLDLWMIYSENTSAWNRMCRLFHEYARTNDVIAEFKREQSVDENRCVERVFPMQAREGYNGVLSYLRDEARVVGLDSAVEYKTVDSCKATVFVSETNFEAAEKLFQMPHVFMLGSNISVNSTKESVAVVFDGLMVLNLKLEDRYSADVCGLLKQLEAKQYIAGLHIEGGTASFVYSTSQVKRLLTNENEIVETYVYHKAKEAAFDDVVCGCEASLNDGAERIRCGCIVTSGFKSLIIECTQSNYDKLMWQAKHIGINATPVLVVNDPDADGSKEDSLNVAIKQAEKAGVITVLKRSDISNIDKILRDLLA